MIIKIILIAYLVSFYLSLPGLFSKAGYNGLKGLIPFYNIYILIELLEINPFLLILLSLGLIFLPIRGYLVTLVFLFIPFLIADAYDKKPITGLITCILPFIMFPFIAYFSGTYRYDMED